MNNLKKILAGFALAGVTALNPVSADTESPLPSTMAWTSYPTSSTNYAQLLALGNVLKKKFNVSVRVLPGDNDVSRMTPLRTGRVDLCGCGIASYYASEGVLLFADAAWGPQPVRVIRTSIADFGMGLVVAGDLDVKTPADLKGKKVAWVRGAPSLNLGTEAYLAFGGLSWDDVERVEFPGYNRSFDGIIQGLADAAFTMTSAPAPEQVAASPRGIT
ncbi:TAXI family TRAP transporter solute-binding subunit [Alloalcanivorax xenomutans]|uniref:TAXI family TRAP transporter solute-binding subunit n=1 Tax=Alloalcanivorax xenomutans TaxID=1094342 RepID=UPI003A8126E7